MSRPTIPLVLALVFATACGPTRSPDNPRDVLAAYARALHDGRVRDAYAWLSDDARKTMPFDAFARMVKENPEETQAIATALTRPSGTPSITATVTTPDGDTLLLRYEDRQWRVDGSAIDYYGQDSPEAALKSFVRAYRNKRYDVLLRFAPDSKREGLDATKLKTAFEGEQHEELERLTEAIGATLPTATIERLGDRATMSYGQGGTIELVREHGIWKIEEF